MTIDAVRFAGLMVSDGGYDASGAEPVWRYTVTLSLRLQALVEGHLHDVTGEALAIAGARGWTGRAVAYLSLPAGALGAAPDETQIGPLALAEVAGLLAAARAAWVGAEIPAELVLVPAPVEESEVPA